MFARQVMGRPFLAPPGVPADRAVAAQGVHGHDDRTRISSPKPTRSKLEITPVSGEDIQKLVAEIYRTPAAIVQKSAQALK